jgi:creatinine amidohydrolase
MTHRENQETVDRHHDPVRYWQDMTTVEAAGLVQADPVAVLPLAAIEQHGPHLPLSTDVVIGRGILEAAFIRLPEDFPALALPCQAVGTSSEHEDFAGTLTIAPAALEEMIVSVGTSLATAGVGRLLISNSHGGNRGAIDTAALRLRQEYEMLIVKAHYFRFSRPDDIDLPESEWTHGLHGGALETAMMLHLRPDLVRSEQIRAFPSFGQELERTLTHLRPEGSASFAWSANDLNAEGVVGDAGLATADMGERLVSHYGTILAELITDTRNFPIDRLGQAGA